MTAATEPAALAPVTPRSRGWARTPAGTTVNVELFGRSDGPTVVLAHGWTCSVAFWTPVIHELAGTARIVAYDLPGHGSSPPPAPSEYSTNTLADCLAAVIDGYVPDRERVVVIGHSMGAMGVVAFAGRHPDRLRDRVSAAVLASTGVADLVAGARVMPGPRWSRVAVKRVTAAAMAWRAPIGHASTRLSRALTRYLTLSPDATVEQVRFCERIIRDCPPTVRGRWGATVAHLDLRADVGALTVPTIVITGEADRLTPPPLADALAAGLPDLTELVRLPGVGHMTPVETPDVVTAAIRRQLMAGAGGGHSGPAAYSSRGHP
jgi:pimeloyl-ACP methyl ester carboxylesterase